MKPSEYQKTYNNSHWALFPCKRNSKEPATPHGFKDASKDPDQHQIWWDNGTDFNIAVRTGKASGIFVLDIDVKGDKNGLQWLNEKEEKHGAIPATLTARTPSGGMHYYFSFPEDMQVKCSNGRIAPGIDIKGDAGYVVAPPSKLENGIYEWIETDAGIADAPSWLLEEIAHAARSATTRSIEPSKGLKGLSEGQRDTGIFHYGISLCSKGLAYEEAEKLVLLKAENCNPPFDPKQANKCLQSAYGYEIANRRPLTELGNAERLKDRYGSFIRYIPEYDRWIIWDGTHWIVSELGEIQQYAAIVVRDIPSELGDSSNPDSLDGYRKFARASEKKSSIENMINLAKSLQGLSMHADELDSNDNIFGVANGVIDVDTGDFREAEPKDFVTMQGLVAYEKVATCPRWEQFIDEITNGDEELARYLQRLVGYSLVGGNPEQVFVILHGCVNR